MTKEQIGAVLKDLRMKTGKTQKEVAEILGRKQQIIGHWETGYSQPDANTLFTLCELYGTTVDSAFGFTKKADTKVIDLKCNGLEGFQALLADIYGSCEMEGVMGVYGECLYFSVGTGKNRYALEENDFDRLYNSVKKTIQQMTNLLLKNETIVRHECQKAADMPPSSDDAVPTEDYLSLNAAHERTDIAVTDEMRQHDDSIMDDKNF